MFRLLVHDGVILAPLFLESTFLCYLVENTWDYVK